MGLKPSYLKSKSNCRSKSYGREKARARDVESDGNYKTHKAKYGGLSTARRTMRLSVASVEMTGLLDGGRVGAQGRRFGRLCGGGGVTSLRSSGT